jgi:hypothetical protein
MAAFVIKTGSVWIFECLEPLAGTRGTKLFPPSLSNHGVSPFFSSSESELTCLRSLLPSIRAARYGWAARSSLLSDAVEEYDYSYFQHHYSRVQVPSNDASDLKKND